MSERAWAQRAPLRDVVLAAILLGLDGYLEDDRVRPKFVLEKLASSFEKAGHKEELHGPFRNMTVAELRIWAQEKFGDTPLA